MGKYVELDELRADEAVVFDLLDELRLAWQKILNTYPEQKGHKLIGYMDGAMAAHNFHKLVLHHLIEESEMPPGAAALWLGIWRDTWTRAMNEDIARFTEEHLKLNPPKRVDPRNRYGLEFPNGE